MNVVERTNKLLDLLEHKDFMMVDEIAEISGVSKATVRRDLQELEEKGIVRRFRGGVCLKDKVLIEEQASMSEMMRINLDSKHKVAHAAACLVEDGDMLFLDSGSTTYAMVPFINASDIHVVTNNIEIATQLINRKIPTFLLGGEIALESKSAFGEDVIAKLETMTFDKAFLGTRGVDESAGYSTTAQQDKNVKSTVIQHSQQNYVLADASKLCRRKFFTFGQLSDCICITEETPKASFLGKRAILV